MNEDPLEKFFFGTKSHNGEKSKKGDPLLSPGFRKLLIEQRFFLGFTMFQFNTQVIEVLPQIRIRVMCTFRNT